MWKENVALVGQYPNLNINAVSAQSLGSLADLNEQRLVAYETPIPGTIWFVPTLTSALTCFVVGYSMGRRLLLSMFVLPLTVAIVLSLVSELDGPRTGFLRVDQQRMERPPFDLKRSVVPNR